MTVTLQSNNGYADSIGLGCGTLPMGITCHFESNTVDLKGGGTSSIHLTVDTSTPLGAGATAMNSARGPRGLFLAGLFLPGGLLFGWVTIRLMDRSDTDGWEYALMLTVWALPFVTILMGLAYLPGSFLPILALTARLFWRIRRTEPTYAAETTPKFVRPALQP